MSDGLPDPGEYGQVVGAADAAAQPGDVGAVDMQRNCDVIAVIADPVDVAGRRKATDLARAAGVAADLLQAGLVLPEGVKLLILGALQYAEHAPRDVIMDRGLLSGTPDERADREGAVRLGMQHVADVAVRAACSFRPGEDLRAGQVEAHFPGDQFGRLAPVGVVGDGAADSGGEVSGTSGVDRANERHLASPSSRNRMSQA